MTQQVINIGAAPDDHTGDPIRTSFNKVNQNFTELYSGGSIVAGTTPTTGFTAGQIVTSDGSKTQAVGRSAATAWGDASHPMFMSSQNGDGSSTLWMSATNYPGAFGIGFQLFDTVNFGISMSGSSGYFGFNTGDNWMSTSPTIALAPDATGGQPIAAIRGIGNPAVATSTRFYNTYGAANAEWGAIDWITAANVLTIGAQKRGTGVLRSVNIVGQTLTLNAGGAVRLTVSSTLLTATVPIVTPSYTFATLPAPATAGAGARAFITDCNATTFYTAAAGGGTNKVPVFSDGAAWRIG